MQKCELLAINVKVLNKSKRNTVAFKYKRRREFEITFMENGLYRISTRFLGYRNVMYKYKGPVTKTEDPDGRRYNFFVQVYNDKELNKLVWKMLGEGFDLVPKTELI